MADLENILQSRKVQVYDSDVGNDMEFDVRPDDLELRLWIKETAVDTVVADRFRCYFQLIDLSPHYIPAMTPLSMNQ
jgi:hypothetical protein